MIDVTDIAAEFRSRICSEIRIAPQGADEFRIFTPFKHNDGDLITLVLRKNDGRWLITDRGDTFMRLSYRLDERALRTEGRSRLIESALTIGGAEDWNGELVHVVDNDQFGDALYRLIQTVLRVSDVALLTQERVRSTFFEDLRQMVEAVVPDRKRVVPEWHHRELDPHGLYTVDWRIDTPEQPLFLFALTSTAKVKDATIALHQFQQWQLDYHSVGVFQDFESVSRKAIAQFSNVSDKMFPHLPGNVDRIRRFIERRTISSN